ncbi:hypothetical protein F383_35753 [Gossypium arboreum]|uniref:Uncharacterized protein n=1 Tax=Gossypium arboreum TaxID=29729 RepID=A0A0B0NB95_GOSAR|nr:hypothetical protein F383_35753 [Gossypium arboreum]
MCASKTLSGIVASICDYRPRLGRWHCMIYVIIRVSYPILNGSSGNSRL